MKINHKQEPPQTALGIPTIKQLCPDGFDSHIAYERYGKMGERIVRGKSANEGRGLKSPTNFFELNTQEVLILFLILLTLLSL